MTGDIVISHGDVVENALRLRWRAGITVRSILTSRQRVENKVSLTLARIGFLRNERHDGGERGSTGGRAADKLGVDELPIRVGGANAILA